MLTRRRRPRTTVLIAAAAMFAAAAAVLLFIEPWSPESHEVAYEIEGPLGGVREARGSSPTGSRAFLPHSRLRLIARPIEEPRGAAPVLRVFALRGDRVVEAPHTAIEVGRGGTSRFEVRAGDLFDEAGTWDLHVVLVDAEAATSGPLSRDELLTMPVSDRHVYTIDYSLEGR
jgi:hypothetical protein